jgi:2'-deoxynucleoside 5'-phosphate N-hydrolase
MRIFFAGPLTDLINPEQTKAFYKKMADVAVANGCDYYWAFMRGTDPELNPDVPAARVFQIDTYELEKSDIMVAYVGEPSVGTGQEVEYAREHNIPVYILFEKAKHISRMLLGAPNVKGTIAYDTQEDALSQLDTLLKSLRHT